jgi:glycerol-3-phosphate acyltransferase PlsY
MVTLLLAMTAGYLLGSVPTGFWVAKVIKGIDIRQHGSGNVGASNVFRTVGKGWGVAVLVIDVLKGFLAARPLASFFYEWDPFLSRFLFSLLVGIAAVSGHNWTFFLRFKGGKGVATSLGMSLGLLPAAALSAFGVWWVVLFMTGYISVSSIAAALSFPLWVALFYRSLSDFSWVLALCVVSALLIVYMHRTNILRLREGSESKVWKR